MAGRPRKQKVTAAASSEEYVVKVWVNGTRRVSRTLAFRGDQTLDDVHRAIFEAFDRFDQHLYAFYFPKLIPKRGACLGMVKQFAPPEMVEDQGSVGIDGPRDSTMSRLDALGLKVGKTFEYLFDFGDSWLHEVEVVGIGPQQPGRRYPSLLEKKGVSPPQYADVDMEDDASETQP
jgi:hypothetical protein